MPYLSVRKVVCLTAFFIALTSGCAVSGVTVTKTPESRQSAQLEQDIFQAVNNTRATNGMQPLVWDEVIAAVARGYSKEMASGSGALSHDGAEERMEVIAQEIPWRATGENLAFSSPRSDIVSVVLGGWMGSTGHRENILGDYTHTGLGVAESPDGLYYITQIFILPR